MWIVRLALRRPYTFVVMAVLIAILGASAILSMPVDIFPYIDIPVVSIVWNYSGLSPEEMEKRMVTIFERAMTTTVNDIEHIESQSYNGVSVIRIYFQPGAHIDSAESQVVANGQSTIRAMPRLRCRVSRFSSRAARSSAIRRSCTSRSRIIRWWEPASCLPGSRRSR